MKKISWLVVAIILVLTGKAQLPCSTFENPNPIGNWVGVNTNNINFLGGNTLDNSQYASVNDNSGASSFGNSVDYQHLGLNHLGRCLCFDIKLMTSGAIPNPTFYPVIFIEDVVNGIGTGRYITFTATTPRTEHSDWVRICAPIEHASGPTLPSNTDGFWSVPAGLTFNDFNTILDNSLRLSFPIDLNAAPNETWGFDNVCLKNCNNCTLNFNLQSVFNSDGSATVTFDPMSDAAIHSYEVDWGDGSPHAWSFNTPIAPHNYTAPGTYVVCVTQYDERGNAICRKCMTFCYSAITMESLQVERIGHPVNPSGNSDAITKIPLTGNNERMFAVFPNPAKDYVEVSLPRDKQMYPLTICLTDGYGKIISNTELKNRDAENFRINTGGVDNGIYQIKMISKNKTETQKLSISK